MKSLNKKIFIFALMLALITASLTYNYLNQIKEANTTMETKIILVAAVNILPGQKISPNMLKEIEVRKDSYTETGVQNKNEIINKTAKEKILQGETIPSERLIQEDEKGLSYIIPEGKRALSIAINEFSGVADMIKPNDFVDIYVTVSELSINTQDSTIVYPKTSILLLQNIQILAVSKQVLKTDNERTDIPSKYAVTLAVAPSDGEKLVLGEEVGNIKLGLRGVGDDSIYLTPGVIREDLVTEKGKVVIYN